MLLVVTDPDKKDLAATDSYEMDMEIGNEGNDFEISCDVPLSEGCLAYVDGTEIGGVVDRVAYLVERGVGRVAYSGRTWSGVLAAKVVMPPSSGTHFEVSGDANRAISSVIEHIGAGDMFAADPSPSGIEVSYRFDRFTDAYSGLRSMLGSSGAKLSIRYEYGHVVLRAERITNYTDEVDSDLFSFDVERDRGSVNHLIGIGEGEGEQRVVVHRYADRDGNVSDVQTLFGIDEIAAVYDYTNADASELAEETEKKLKELQGQGTVSLNVSPGVSMDVGDTVSARNYRYGIFVDAEITGKVIKVKGGKATAEYYVGFKSAGDRSLSGSSESSGGVGSSYSPGEGIKIVGGVISADVTQSELDAVSDAATEAMRVASNASAEIPNKADKDHTHQASDVVGGVLDADLLPSIPADKLSGIVPSENLPAYVDDVLEGTLSSFPEPGESGKIYVDTDTGKTYRWSGSSYVEISESLALGETSSTAFRGDRGKVAYDHSQKTGNPHGTTASDVGASPEGHKHSATDIASGTLPIASGGTGATTANAAEYAIIGRPPNLTSDITDASPMAFVYTTPNADDGTFYTRAASMLWEYIKGKADAAYAKLSHTHTKSQITDFPTSMPASDVYAWAKAKEKPAYTASEVGAAAKSHTHNYAGSSTPGGAATSASKLATARKITFTGAATGSFSFDGSKDVTVTLEGDSASAQFLAAWPVGSIYPTSSSTPPSVGKWRRLPSMGGNKYLRIE